MKNAILVLACGGFWACKILAATPLEPMEIAMAPGGEGEFFSELPVVLSVTRLQQNMKDVPGFVTVIDAETIRHSGARDFAELLRGVPGFQVAFNPYGAPVATYHGMGSTVPKSLQVLIDGRTQYSTLIEGGVSWNLIDVSLEDIERIEVLRGSNSPTYGSNSFMGVVNVITRHAASTRGALVSYSKGNQGIDDRLARIGFGGEAWSARLTTESKRDEGEPLPHDNRKTERVNLRIDSDWPDGDSLRVHAGMLRVDLGVGFPPGAGATAQLTNPRRSLLIQSNFVQANWRHHDVNLGDTEVRGLRLQQEMDDFYSIVVPVAPGAALSTDFDNSGTAGRTDLELQHTVEMDHWRLVGGVGWRQDVARNALFYGPGRRVEQTIERSFGEVEWRPNAYLTANLAATFEDDSLSGRSSAPRVAINLHVTPSQTIKFIAGKSRRLPTLYESQGDERLYETVGTTVPGFGPVPVGTLLNVGVSSSGQVRPEEVKSREVGYLGEFREYGISLDARWFREDLKQRIQPTTVSQPLGPSCPVFELASGRCDYDDFVNGTEADISGWETQLLWQPTKTTRFGITHARVDIESRWLLPASAGTPALAESNVDYLNRSSPRKSTSLSMRQRLFDRVTVAAFYHDVDGFKWTRNGQTFPYHRFDWRVAYDFRLASARGELAWTVRNDGQNHAEWQSGNASGVPHDNDLIGTRHFVSLRFDY